MSPEDVLDFYRTEMKSLGWTVTEETPADSTTGEAPALTFENTALGSTWTGNVAAATFMSDTTYTQGRLQLSISAETAESPSSLTTPTP